MDRGALDVSRQRPVSVVKIDRAGVRHRSGVPVVEPGRVRLPRLTGASVAGTIADPCP